MMYSIAYGRTAEHAAALKRGLERMCEGFTAELCGICEGHGERRQRYIEGMMMGPCDYCGATGLRQGDEVRAPAPLSVVNQVLVAGGGQMVPDPRPNFSRPRKPLRLG